MRVIQNLWFEKDMEQALELYTRLIPGSEVNWMSTLPADSPGGPAGTVKLAGFTIGGQDYIGLEGGPLDPFNHSFSIMIECDTQAEIDWLWDVLSEDGEIEQCGWLRDRWGLYWQISPRRLRELVNDPDPAKARRVSEAMLKMDRFDIAALESAAAA